MFSQENLIEGNGSINVYRAKTPLDKYVTVKVWHDVSSALDVSFFSNMITLVDFSFILIDKANLMISFML